MADVVTFDRKSDAQAATIPSSVRMVLLAGYHAYGDAPMAEYVRVSSQPSYPGKFQSADP